MNWLLEILLTAALLWVVLAVLIARARAVDDDGIEIRHPWRTRYTVGAIMAFCIVSPVLGIALTWASGGNGWYLWLCAPFIVFLAG